MAKKKINCKNHRQNVLQDDHGSNYDNLHQLSDNADEEVEEDYISKLPDDLLYSILSLLPPKSAVKTAALSTRLRDFWSKTLTLNGSKGSINRVLCDFILSFDPEHPLEQPRKLKFTFDRGLVLLATLGLKSRLRLDFSKGKLDFPRDSDWDLRLNIPKTIAKPLHNPVKHLDLTGVNYLTNSAISSVLFSFDSLKSLRLCRCEGLRSLRISEAVSKGLRSLTVLDCPHLKSLSFAESHWLVCFRYRGPLCEISFDSTADFQDVKLESYDGPSYNSITYEDYDDLLFTMRHVKVLSLNGLIFEEIVMPLLCNYDNLEFKYLKELWWIDSSEHCIDSIMFFLQFSPSLERLFVTIDPSSFGTKKDVDNNKRKQRRETLSQMRLVKLEEFATLSQLKLVKLEGFAEGYEESAISFRERLFDQFHVEPRFVIVRNKFCSMCLIKIPKQKGRGNPKNGASNKASYKFVEETKKDAGLCSPHIHMLL